MNLSKNNKETPQEHRWWNKCFISSLWDKQEPVAANFSCVMVHICARQCGNCSASTLNIFKSSKHVNGWFLLPFSFYLRLRITRPLGSYIPGTVTLLLFVHVQMFAMFLKPLDPKGSQKKQTKNNFLKDVKLNFPKFHIVFIRERGTTNAKICRSTLDWSADGLVPISSCPPVALSLSKMRTLR